jgi:hypothetical protein
MMSSTTGIDSGISNWYMQSCLPPAGIGGGFVDSENRFIDQFNPPLALQRGIYLLKGLLHPVTPNLISHFFSKIIIFVEKKWK